MTAPIHIQYIPTTTFTTSTTLPDVVVPPGSVILVLISLTNVTGTSPTISIRLQGLTKSGTGILLKALSAQSSSITLDDVINQSPSIFNIRLNLGGTNPSFDVELDLVIIPPVSGAV